MQEKFCSLSHKVNFISQNNWFVSLFIKLRHFHEKNLFRKGENTVIKGYIKFMRNIVKFMGNIVIGALISFFNFYCV